MLLLGWPLASPVRAQNIELAPYVQKLDSSYFPPYLEPSVGLLKGGEIDSALSTLERMAAELKRPASPEKIYLLQGLAHALKAQHQEALNSYSQALRLRGSNCDIYFFMAASYLALKQSEKALSALQDALWFNRMSLIKPEEFYLRLGQIQHSLGRSALASAAFNQALNKNPAFAPARAELLGVTIEGGKRGAAIHGAREALAQAPDSLEAKVGLAKALLLNADRNLNQDDIKEAIKITQAPVQGQKLGKADELLVVPTHVRALLAAGEVESAEKVLGPSLKRYPEEAALQSLKSQVSIERQAQGSSPAAPLSSSSATSSP